MPGSKAVPESAKVEVAPAAPAPKQPSLALCMVPVKSEAVATKQENLNTQAAALRAVLPKPTEKAEPREDVGEVREEQGGGDVLTAQSIRAMIEALNEGDLKALLATMEEHPRFIEYIGEVMDEAGEPDYRFGFYEPAEDAIHFACWLEEQGETQPAKDTVKAPERRKPALKKSTEPKPVAPAPPKTGTVGVNRVKIVEAAKAGLYLQTSCVREGLHPGELQRAVKMASGFQEAG